MKLSVRDKAAAALLDGRITVLKCSPAGLAIEAASAHSAARYVAAIYRDEGGVRRRSCTCPNGRVHPIAPRCWHVRAAELLSDQEGSRR